MKTTESITIHVVHGLPASGKSTWVNSLIETDRNEYHKKYMKSKKRLFIILILTLFPIISLLLYVYSHGEGYCVIYPSIDTVYANHFSKKGFEKVELGMSKDTVISLIGMPLFYEKQQNNEEIFFYSMDGACSLGGYQYADFAWLSYSITFKDQKVISKDIHIYYD